MGLQNDSGFIASMKQMALDVTKATGRTCTMSDKGTALGALFCVVGPETLAETEALGVDAAATGRVFEIPAQTGFGAANVRINNVITLDSHNYHVKTVENEDGLGIWWKFYGVCTHPNYVGAN